MRSLLEPKLTELQIRIFWAHIPRKSPDECWEWEGGRLGKYAKQHYGVYTIKGTRYNAHRLAYWFATGEWLDSLQVCHACDNPPCCNPAHLFAGTQMDNVHDMIQKGRQSSGNRENTEKWRGENNANAKINDEIVRSIRGLHFQGSITVDQCAKVYGLHRRQMWAALHGESWKHIPLPEPLQIDPNDPYGRLVCCALSKRNAKK